MSLGLIVDDGNNSETMAEKIERLEQEIEDLKSDVENERQRGDEHYDRAEKLQEKFDEFFEYDDDDDFQAYKDCGATLENLIEVYQKMENGDLIDADEDDLRRAEIARDLKLSYERLSMGVLSEIDEIIKLTNELIELHE